LIGLTFTPVCRLVHNPFLPLAIYNKDAKQFEELAHIKGLIPTNQKMLRMLSMKDKKGGTVEALANLAIFDGVRT